MQWKPANTGDDKRVEIPSRWLHIHYYEALNVLFRFENSLRVFVYVVLKNKEFGNWQNCNFTPPGSDEQLSIGQATRRRVNQAETFGYVGYDIRAPMMHLTSGELVELITADAYWGEFAKYFRGTKEIIKNKLLEIGSIRNSLAHFRPIKADDVELAKQNCRHTMMVIEECLQNLAEQYLRVPTNTPDDWYKSVGTLGADPILITPFYSSDECWTSLRLYYQTPQLDKRSYGGEGPHYGYTLANIKTPNILSHHKEIQTYVTYVGESRMYPVIDEKHDLRISKHINLVFSTAALAEHHEKIATDLTELIRTVAQECELLRNDSAARGNLIEPVYTSSWWSSSDDGKGKWNHSYNKLKQDYDPQHPDEYWGTALSTGDIIAGSTRYPWMPDDISSAERLSELLS